MRLYCSAERFNVAGLDMLTLIKAIDRLREAIQPLPPVECMLTDAPGHYLAEAVAAPSDLPAADLSAMDGYAAASADLDGHTPLPVAVEVPAGHVPHALPHHTAARIFTGAMLPPNTDTVVPQEQATLTNSGAVVLEPLSKGSFVRRRAEVCAAGTNLAKLGDRVTPPRLALLGAAGVSRVRVVTRPRVAVVSTGAELVGLNEPREAGQIGDTNSPMLAALAADAGFEVSQQARAADQLPELTDALRRSMERAELVITSGGVSVGDYDLVPAALTDLGAEVLFHRLSVRPGKPVLVARAGKTWITGLPGNPVSALAGWHLFVRPLGEALAGNPAAFQDATVPAALTAPSSNRGDRTVLAPARLVRRADRWSATVLDWKGSHDLLALVQANALAVLEVGATLDAGDTVDCYPIDRGSG